MRAFRADDLDSVAAILRSNIPKYFREYEEKELRDYLAETADDYYVLEFGGEIVGAGGIGLNEDQTVSLCWGMIRSDHLGTGLGKQLTEFRLEKAGEKFPGLPLVISTSQHTRGFYEKYGFRVTEHTPDKFAPGIDECKMRKEP
jgi:[ribosomal protein S18]-alanine N-acetyltransferase